jgi:tRNA A37 N6-isopentenylltransferase MiaA
MERRNVIKSLGIGLLGLGNLPSWANNWNMGSFDDSDLKDSDFFAKIVESIIPETDTRGAKTIGAHVYLEKVIKDCYSKEIQEEVNQTLNNLKQEAVSKFQKTFEQLTPNQALEILKNNQKNKKTIEFFKNLTIRAYISSEYYLTNHKNYQMAPAHFHGCVEI